LEELVKISVVITASLIGFTISGVVGIGGGLVALPAIIWVLGVKEAVPLLSIAQLIGSASRAYLHKDGIDWNVVGYFAIGSIPVAIGASLLFVSIDSAVIVRLLGVLLILMALYTKLPMGRNFHMPLWGFMPLGSATGFISALFGVPGPFATVFYLCFGLTASAYVGTSSVGYGFIQIPKLIVFGLDGLLDSRLILIGAGLSTLSVLGAYLGKLLLGRIPENTFATLITIILVAAGISLILKN
tara:strand:+ start:1689 stop:2417 length:729 start_codon:yes stop_codon:yes gene_type:complete